MGFYKYDENGLPMLSPGKLKAAIDCQKAIENGEKIRVEQSHKAEADINNIIKKHGIDLIQKTALLRSQEYQFDDVTGNDFQEAMFKVTKAKQTFEKLPSPIRKKFDNNPAMFLDFVQNPENSQQMIEMGLAVAVPPPQPIQVEVINPPPAEPPAS